MGAGVMISMFVDRQRIDLLKSVDRRTRGTRRIRATEEGKR